MFRYAIKSDGRKVTGADTSNFAKKVNLTSLKSDVDKIENDKLKHIPTDLSKLNNVADDDVDKKAAYGELAKKVVTIDGADVEKLVWKADHDTKIIIMKIAKKISNHDK